MTAQSKCVGSRSQYARRQRWAKNHLNRRVVFDYQSNEDYVTIHVGTRCAVVIRDQDANTTRTRFVCATRTLEEVLSSVKIFLPHGWRCRWCSQDDLEMTIDEKGELLHTRLRDFPLKKRYSAQ